MKNNLIKYYAIAFCMVVNFSVFALPPSDNSDTGDMDSTTEAVVAPIDEYVLVLALIGLVLVFFKMKAIQKKSLRNK